MDYKKELKVAFSTKTQPIWFRVLKWTLFLGVGYFLYTTRYFWFWIIGIPLFGMVFHLFYRNKTKQWTKPWGGFKGY